MMLLGSLVNMLAIFAGCFVGVTLGRFIPERFNLSLIHISEPTRH